MVPRARTPEWRDYLDLELDASTSSTKFRYTCAHFNVPTCVAVPPRSLPSTRAERAAEVYRNFGVEALVAEFSRRRRARATDRY